MKKLLYFAAAAALVFGAAACNGNKENVNEQGLVDDGGTKLTPDAQKSKIEETADALMSDLDLKVWQSEYDLVMNTVEEMQEKDVDASAIEERFKAIVDAWTTATGEEPGVVYTHVAHLSELTGHFTENANGAFDYEAANDLVITFFSGNKTISATASVTDRDEKILLNASFSSSYSEDGKMYESGDYTYAYIPEKANLGITVDGKSIASLEINLNYTDVNKDGEADQNDKLDLGYTMTVGAYTFAIDQADYATDAASVKLRFLRDNKLVLGADAKAAAKFVEYAETYENGSYTHTELVPVSAEVNVDIEGKIQLAGNLPSGEALQAAVEDMNAAMQKYDYEAYKKALDKFEKSFGIGVYYDGNNTLQATLGFEAISAQQGIADYNGDGVINEQDFIGGGFYVNPVIRFLDGTTVGVEEYFSEDNFSGLMEKVLSWAYGIMDYLGVNEEQPTQK